MTNTDIDEALNLCCNVVLDIITGTNELVPMQNISLSAHKERIETENNIIDIAFHLITSTNPSASIEIWYELNKKEDSMTAKSILFKDKEDVEFKYDIETGSILSIPDYVSDKVSRLKKLIDNNDSMLYTKITDCIAKKRSVTASVSSDGFVTIGGRKIDLASMVKRRRIMSAISTCMMVIVVLLMVLKLYIIATVGNNSTVDIINNIIIIILIFNVVLFCKP